MLTRDSRWPYSGTPHIRVLPTVCGRMDLTGLLCTVMAPRMNWMSWSSCWPREPISRFSSVKSHRIPCSPHQTYIAYGILRHIVRLSIGLEVFMDLKARVHQALYGVEQEENERKSADSNGQWQETV